MLEIFYSTLQNYHKGFYLLDQHTVTHDWWVEKRHGLKTYSEKE